MWINTEESLWSPSEGLYYGGLDAVQVPEDLVERNQVRQPKLAAALEALEDANVPDDEVGISVEVQDRDVGVACGN